MLHLKRLEVEGFGPFADRQHIEFPEEAGVTVIYGENMRGKTSLLNAIRFAFFGTVLGRGSRASKLHKISNRELAAEGKYGFYVALTFDYDGQEYELYRECRPKVEVPESDDDYSIEVLLRKGGSALGPQEREKALQHILPKEVSRFFLFDGELLQEYEELLVNESETGPKISEAIERILGVPILKRGRAHLTKLSDDAEKSAAVEASRHQTTQSMGASLQAATDQKEAHKKEVARQGAILQELAAEREDLEQALGASQKYTTLLQDHEGAKSRLAEIEVEIRQKQSELQAAMRESWRSLLNEPVRYARKSAQEEAQRQYDELITSLRVRAVVDSHCVVCEQDVGPEAISSLRTKIPDEPSSAPMTGVSTAMVRLADLGKFTEKDNAGEVRQISKRIRSLQLEEMRVKDRITDLDMALSDTDPDALHKTKLRHREISDKLNVVAEAIRKEKGLIEEQDQAIRRISDKLQRIGTPDVVASQVRAKLLRESAEVVAEAVERYKAELRGRVEATATDLFLKMTTEKTDYAGLTINESYGLTIRHCDGRAEEARSAGAEHVVALALMGALQKNAPLRGPIVMDSPFGRLDENHTNNVVMTLPEMANQVVLLVYEAEVGRSRVRELLRGRLLREYELDKVSARRTNIREVR